MGVPVAFVGIPALTAWVRGICWESAVIAAVALAAVLFLLRLRVAAVCLALVLLLLPAAVMLAGWSRLEYRTFDVFGPPSLITHCGRAYDRGSTVPRSVLDGREIQDVGVTPSGSAVLAAGCGTTGMWVQTGATTVVAYALQGGP